MGEEALFNRYAVALVELSVERHKEVEYRKTVKVLKNILKENKEFFAILSDPNYSLKDKYKLIDKVFVNVPKDITSFIKIIINNGRAFYLYDIFKETLFRFDDFLGIEEGEIYLAEDISDEDIDKIRIAIEKDIGKKVELDKVIDPSLIGGFKVKLKDGVYDSSISTKITKLRNTLINGGK